LPAGRGHKIAGRAESQPGHGQHHCHALFQLPIDRSYFIRIRYEHVQFFERNARLQEPSLSLQRVSDQAPKARS
jgi:hypothetical protein